MSHVIYESTSTTHNVSCDLWKYIHNSQCLMWSMKVHPQLTMSHVIYESNHNSQCLMWSMKVCTTHNVSCDLWKYIHNSQCLMWSMKVHPQLTMSHVIYESNHNSQCLPGGRSCTRPCWACWRPPVSWHTCGRRREVCVSRIAPYTCTCWMKESSSIITLDVVASHLTLVSAVLSLVPV